MDKKTKKSVKAPEKHSPGLAKPAAPVGTLKDAARQASELRYRTIFDHAGDAIFVHDINGKMLDVNQVACDRLGFTHEELLRMTPMDFDSPEYAKLVPERIRQLITDKHIVFETCHVRKDGTQIPTEISSRLIEHNGQQTILSICRDITERKYAELKYKTIIDTAMDCFYIIDAQQGNILEVNDAYCSLIGYSRNELLKMNLRDIEATENPEKIAQHMQRIIKQGADRFYTRHRSKDGRILDIETSVNYMKESKTFVVFMHDITKRIRAEEALRENEARLNLALQSAHMGVWRWEIKENRRYFDDLTCQLLGIDIATFTGAAEEFFRVVHPEDREKIKTALARTIEQDALYEPTYRVVRPDGSVHYITARGRLVRDDKGQPARINGIVWDITDQRLLEEEIINAQKLESIGTLAGGIAHDFNNLLQGIFGYISMAKLTFDQKEKSLAMLEQAEKALHQSVNLTSQLLTFSKGGKPVKRVVALRPLVENSVAFALSGSRVTYEIATDEDLRSVEADGGQISQMIQNIVLNADQAMPLGGMIRVSIRNMHAHELVPPADLQGDLVEISIRDQGTGIPPEHLTRIFDPYFTTKEKGSGLGLATTYSIIKNHGGLVRVQSEVGKGTTFLIYLPASHAKEEYPESPVSQAATRKGRILVLDDDKMIRSIACEMLATIGHEVTSVGTGETALEAYRAARDAGRAFDLVILDLTIRGGMGGVETLRNLLEIDPAVKAVVSSGYSDDAVMSDYHKYGFKARLTKPYRLGELRDTLNALLS